MSPETGCKLVNNRFWTWSCDALGRIILVKNPSAQEPRCLLRHRIDVCCFRRSIDTAKQDLSHLWYQPFITTCYMQSPFSSSEVAHGDEGQLLDSYVMETAEVILQCLYLWFFKRKSGSADECRLQQGVTAQYIFLNNFTRRLMWRKSRHSCSDTNLSICATQMYLDATPGRLQKCKKLKAFRSLFHVWL